MEYKRFVCIQGNFKLYNDKTNKADRIYKVREYTDYLSKNGKSTIILEEELVLMNQ